MMDMIDRMIAAQTDAEIAAQRANEYIGTKELCRIGMRAAIEAMRGCVTEHMERAGEKEATDGAFKIRDVDFARVWSAMIDAALVEQKEKSPTA